MIGEASLPDVDSGYFIHSPATAAEHFREYGPAPIDGEPIALVFASDGGGAICSRSEPADKSGCPPRLLV
jgi:hypothetical protein